MILGAIRKHFLIIPSSLVLIWDGFIIVFSALCLDSLSSMGSKWLLACIIFYLLESFLETIKLIFYIRYPAISIPSIAVINMFSSSWLLICLRIVSSFGITLVSFYFMFKYIPWTRECTYPRDTCTVYRILGTVSVINWFSFCISMVYIAVRAVQLRESFRSQVIRTFSWGTIFQTDEECPVCYERGGDWVKLSCDHKFHRGCIEQWVSQHPTCPLCRNPILFEGVQIL